MPRPMRSYTVSSSNKRATLLYAGWTCETIRGRERWFRNTRDREENPRGLPLDSAFAAWKLGGTLKED